MLRKLFNKCIEINGIIKLLFYWSTHARPIRPQLPACSVRNRPAGPSAAAAVRERARPVRPQPRPAFYNAF